MNKAIAHILLSRIGNMSFIDLYGGIVSVQEQEDMVDDGLSGQKKIVTRFPVTCDVINYGACPEEPGKLIPFIPDSSRKGILYFEDAGVTPEGRQGPYFKFRSNIRLVVWLNTKYIELNPCHELTMPVMTNILLKLTNAPFNQNNFLKIQVSANKIPKTGKEIFSNYTYEEAYTQYLMLPFEYFAIDLAVTYMISPECISQIQIKKPEQC